MVDHEGVVFKLTHDIEEKFFNVDDEDGQVEIIGWLYQYYNTEPKKAAFEKSGKITKEEIPAVTQLFTPDWIVRYMVENSLGRLWVEGHPDSDLRKNWKYYLDEAPQEPEVQAKLATIRKGYAALSPEDLTLIDPCMGSGHILVYAFEVLMQIYTSVGYSERDAAKSILEHNLYGLDIDDRAYQLAYFAVMMKARQYNRRILNGENTCHVHAIQESNNINRAHLKFFGAGLDDLEKNTAKMQLEGLLDILTDAKEYGSILNVPEYNWALLRRFVGGIDDEVQISLESAGVEETADELKKLIDLGETMARKYWITVTNPPYMGGGGMDNKLSDYVRKNYTDSKSDLFSVCMERGNQMTRANGFNCMVTMQSWMFLSSFENVRVKLLQTKTITTLMHMDNMVMGIAFGTAATSFRNTKIDNYKGTYTYIKYCDIENDKPKVFPELNNRFAQVSVERYSGILGTPVAYWVSDSILEDFHSKDNIGNIAPPKQGLATADNERFLRLWHEISVQKIGFGYSSCEEAADSKKKYFPYNKGGSFRRWYGNRDYVVDWENDGYEIKNFKDSNGKVRSRPQNLQYYFKPAITWSDVTSGSFSGRYVEQGFMFDIKGSSGFPNVKLLPYVIGLLNSKIAQVFIKILNPTVTTQVGDMTRIPVVKGRVEEVIRFANECVEYAKNDWDSFETSWNFKIHPLVKLKMAGAYAWGDNEPAMRIESAYKAWKETCNGRFEKLKANEEELNRIFIDIYGLQDELTPEVEDKDVTVRKADLQRDIKSLLSYAVGCMFGRYSIYKDGLLFAGEPYSLQAFVDKLNDRPGTVSAEELERAYRNEGVVVDEMFFPDEDNVIPITDEEYLDDDIVARLCDWLKAVYGAATLEENLNFIAKALGNKGSTSREVIRNYFLNDFFKDHCQTYSVTGSGKRPIYWLFDSGKQNGFKALIYLHRYTPDTIGTLRVDYLHKMQRVYDSEKARMQDMMDHTNNTREKAAAEKRRNKLQLQIDECQKYDEKIGHLALARIALDLDDGVKVNYRKLQTAADGKFYEVLADSKNIMAKEKK